MKTNIEDRMETDFLTEQRYYKAQKKVKEIKGFYTHLTIYCLIIPIIIFINLKYVPHFHWFWFSVLGWGFGLFFHWLGVFGFNLLGFGKNWEERKIKEFMNEKN
ncbi:2TM domain-containing protein [Polaribacter porphyrae]|nr:2TM domain-containing protein [Polaribacter porphyrae]